MLSGCPVHAVALRSAYHRRCIWFNTRSQTVLRRAVDGRISVQKVEGIAPAQMNGIIAVRPSARSCAIFADTDMVCSAAARVVTADRCLMEGLRLPCAHLLRPTLQRRPIANLHVQATRNGRKKRRNRRREKGLLNMLHRICKVACLFPVSTTTQVIRVAAGVADVRIHDHKAPYPALMSSTATGYIPYVKVECHVDTRLSDTDPSSASDALSFEQSAFGGARRVMQQVGDAQHEIGMQLDRLKDADDKMRAEALAMVCMFLGQGLPKDKHPAQFAESMDGVVPLISSPAPEVRVITYTNSFVPAAVAVWFDWRACCAEECSGSGDRDAQQRRRRRASRRRAQCSTQLPPTRYSLGVTPAVRLHTSAAARMEACHSASCQLTAHSN